MEPEILQILFEELDKYEHEKFSFARNQRLSEVCNVPPNKAGVYYILKVSNGKKELVYIGSSGTMKKSRKFCNQLLRKRLVKGKQGKKLVCGKQVAMSRQEYFTSQLNDREKLEIYWFVTYDENFKHLPKYVEGVLMQKYFELNGCLPLWNNEF